MGRSNGDGASDASAALVFLPKRKGTSGRDGASAIEARDRRRAEAHAARRVTKLSNSQKRKLKKLAEEERKRSERASVMAMLEANVADERALGLMRATTSLGARETAKEKMRRALKAERAG